MRIEYSDRPVTAWGGMAEMKELLERTKLREVLKGLDLPESKSNNRINSLDTIEAFLVSVWIGCFKFSHTTIVRLDETLRQIFGWKRVASSTTFGRFFRKFSYERNTNVFTQLNEWFFNQIKFDNYVLDVDSTVITRYGNQQGSHKGYNPKKRGRNSHHPLFAFVADIRMVANCWLRSGDTSSSNNIMAFMEETFSVLKNKTIGLFRADSGFFSQNILEYIEQKNIAYVIAARMHSRMQEKIADIKNWIQIEDSNLWMAEMRYKALKWTKERRIVVIRQSTALNANATGKQLTLFAEDDAYYNWKYHCFATNQTLPAREIWEQYKRRADAENRIKELKEDFGAEGFNMDSFYATEAAIKMVCVAYNFMSLFRQVTHRNQAQPRLPTLRFNCFAVGSWIVKDGNSKVLKMSVPTKRRQWYDGLFDLIKKTTFPVSLDFTPD
jgi:hypothetical protein